MTFCDFQWLGKCFILSHTMKNLALIVFSIISLFYILTNAYCEEPANQQQVESKAKYVGKFFEIQVPLENYYFIKGVLAVFGNSFGPKPQNADEEEAVIWDQLLLSYEALRRGIAVSENEFETELGRILQAEKVEFGRKTNKEAYKKWVKEKANEPTELFENQLRHLLQIEKLRQSIMAGIEPKVLEKEAFQEFLNEYNTLELELVQFDTKEDARNFYAKAKKDGKFWEEQKSKNPGSFKRPGSVSLEFLIDRRMPEDAAYRMMRMPTGSIHPPEPIYKGYGVFKVLDKRPADKEQFKKLKNACYEQIRVRKRYAGLVKWFEDLKKQADIKIYKQKTEGGKNE